jgi:hypothetical protein
MILKQAAKAHVEKILLFLEDIYDVEVHLLEIQVFLNPKLELIYQ